MAMRQPMRGNRTVRNICQLSTRILGVGAIALVLSAPTAFSQPQSQENAPAQPAGGRTDLTIESDVLHQLATMPQLAGSQIAASTDNGVVTLSGTAPDQSTSEAAQSAAAKVSGVRSVINKIHIGQAAENTPQPDSNPLPPPAPAQSASNKPSPYPAPQVPQASQPESAPNPPASAQVGANPNQPAYPASTQPVPGSEGEWGPAGPPPDAQNGRIPQLPQDQAGAPGSAQNGYPGQPAQNGYPSQYPQPQAGYPSQSAPQPTQQPAPAYRAPYSPPSAYSQPAPGSPLPPSPPAAPVTLPAGTLLTVRTTMPLDSRRLQPGDTFEGTAAQDIFQNGVLAIPRGATLRGQVLDVKRAGPFRGSAGFALQLTDIDLAGRIYPVATDTFATDTQGKGQYTAMNTAGGAVLGALLGAVTGGGPGMAVGALAGGALGAGASAATPSPREIMPPETLLRFHLQAPVTVNPVSYQEAERLAASAPQRPRLQPRPNPYHPYPPPPPPPYPYWR
jgi:hypothetical protein